MTNPQIASLLWYVFLNQTPVASQNKHDDEVIPESPQAMSDDEMDEGHDLFVPLGEALVSDDQSLIPISPVLHPLPACDEILLPQDDDFVL